MFEDALDGRYPPTGPLDANVRLLMARLILAASEQDFQRVAARGLGRLLHAQVAVASAGFRGELRQIAVIAAWVPRAYNPQLARPPGGGRPIRAVLVTTPLERAMPAYLLWRAPAFTDRELITADGVALALVALQLRWCAQRPANEHSTNEHSTNEQPPERRRRARRAARSSGHPVLAADASPLARSSSSSTFPQDSPPRASPGSAASRRAPFANTSSTSTPSSTPMTAYWPSTSPASAG